MWREKLYFFIFMLGDPSKKKEGVIFKINSFIFLSVQNFSFSQGYFSPHFSLFPQPNFRTLFCYLLFFSLLSFFPLSIFVTFSLNLVERFTQKPWNFIMIKIFINFFLPFLFCFIIRLWNSLGVFPSNHYKQYSSYFRVIQLIN